MYKEYYDCTESARHSTAIHFATAFVNCSVVDLILALKPVILLSVDWRHGLLELGALSVLAATCLAVRR